MKARADSGGFTLVEVMVALAVVAIALPALLVSLYNKVDATAYLRDKSMAHLVAANKLVEVRLLARARERLPAGRDGGVIEMGDREWYWWLDSQPTGVEQFYRIAISVAGQQDQRERPLHTLVAFLSADLASEPAPAAAGGDPAGDGSEGDGQE